MQGKGTLTMRTQIKYFKRAADRMHCFPSSKEDHLSRSLFLLSGGGNDFAAFDPSTDSPPTYIAKMVSTYIEHIQVHIMHHTIKCLQCCVVMYSRNVEA